MPETTQDTPVFADASNPRPHEAISALEAAGLLTTRQAEVYIRRVIQHEPRDDVAEDLGITAYTVDEHRAKAIKRVENAIATADTISEIKEAFQDQVPWDIE